MVLIQNAICEKSNGFASCQGYIAPKALRRIGLDSVKGLYELILFVRIFSIWGGRSQVNPLEGTETEKKLAAEGARPCLLQAGHLISPPKVGW